MLFNELVSAWDTHLVYRPLVGDDLPATIRANFGTVLVASAFGARVEQVEDNPPWVRPFGSRAELAAGLARGPVDLTAGWLPRVVERYRFYREVLALYPPLPDVIRLVLPDLQGPVDTLEMLCGSALYADLIDDPAFVAQALDTVAAAQMALARQLAPLINDGPVGFSHQHGFMIRGRLLLRDDSAIMVSPRMYRRQIAPHDERVLAELGGGGIHSCGNFMHNVGAMLELPSLQCLDFGQSPLNDVDAIYAQARPRRIALVRVQVTAEELRDGEHQPSLPDRRDAAACRAFTRRRPRQCGGIFAELTFTYARPFALREEAACAPRRHLIFTRPISSCPGRTAITPTASHRSW